MPRIHRLPEALANRIAAGEVVERPASVVKELVENALDAGARHIAVELRAGGTKLIVVADDGRGMEPEDAVLAVERFATSKISAPDDLHHIETMGFRGEALPSIGAVSRMRILTRPADRAEGTLVVVEGGVVRKVEPVGCPPGTRVEVADLFYNTPARRKFLSSTNTERAHCHDWVVRLAMARPDVAIKLVHDGQVLFSTAGTGDLLSVIAAAYGSNAARELLPVLLETDDARIFGFVSGPRLIRATRQHQYFFVNGRFVRSRALSHAVTQAYGALLPAGRYPLCSVHLILPATDVDPNVHPTKIEVRFAYEGRVHDLAERAVREALEQAGLRPGTPPPLRPESGIEPADVAQRASASGRLRVSPFADRLDGRDDGLAVYARPADYGRGHVDRPEEAAPLETPAETRRGAGPPAPTRLEVTDAGEASQREIQVLGQLARRYI
ncbi:MAG: DNA mismatch repair endonuclease MutL, partial [Armatimonadetes bacterium]|nr:DNA mismatch repair endonuclease MutL [Armatimonadota bacterium]